MTTTTKTEPHRDDGISQRLEEAGARLVELRDEAAINLGNRVDSLGKVIRKHPLAAVGVGFGLGYLLARIVHR
jgi:ElaB/YqjD/DUF883 family membrane-anchored ribosome-binding protein